MCKTTMCFMRGAVAGVAVGMAAAVAGCCIVKNKKAVSKKASKAARAIGDIFENIGMMMK